jgi:hypothetical protein
MGNSVIGSVMVLRDELTWSRLDRWQPFIDALDIKSVLHIFNEECLDEVDIIGTVIEQLSNEDIATHWDSPDAMEEWAADFSFCHLFGPEDEPLTDGVSQFIADKLVEHIRGQATSAIKRLFIHYYAVSASGLPHVEEGYSVVFAAGSSWGDPIEGQEEIQLLTALGAEEYTPPEEGE